MRAAQILSAALMLRYSFKEEAAAKAIEDAVASVLADGYLTGDLMASGTAKHDAQSTDAMGDLVASRI